MLLLHFDRLSHTILFRELIDKGVRLYLVRILWQYHNIVDEHKYLGHFIQKNLSDNCDMLKQIRSLYCPANMLNKKFGLCSEPVKVLLYKLFCANFYCGSLWCDFTQSVYNKIRVSYNNSFRILLKLPKFCSASEMFVYSDVPNFEALLRKL